MKKIILPLLILLASLTTHYAVAADISFTPIHNYNTKGSFNVAIKNNNDYFPSLQGGLLSNSKINLKEGGNIKIKFKANHDNTIDFSGGKWVLVFNLGLHEEKIKDITKNLKDYRYASNAIVFKIAPETIYKKNYSGNSKGNEVHSSYNSSIDVKKAHHKPLKWNELNISFVDSQTIEVSVNGELAIKYQGSFPSSAYLSLGQDHTTIGYDVDRKMIINGTEYKAKISLK